ncbi:hypothetical protein MK489_08830 [Myxococcota bacterium]|nr:hypothetical protein [Myxococcota bacterium]
MNWRATWGLALVMVGVFLGAWEGFWRARGFTPSVRDDPGLWSATRMQIPENDPEAVAIIGSSRIQIALQPQIVAEASGLEVPTQLGLAMGPSVPVLRHFADESEFSGILITEVNPRLFFQDTRSLDWVTAAHLHEFRSFDRARALEQAIRSGLQQHFAFLLPDLEPRHLAAALGRGELPSPQLITVGADRARTAHFDRLPELKTRNLRVKNQRERSKARFLDDAELQKWLAEIETYVSILQKRGGRVIFVRPPTSLHILADERRVVPRERYWDALARGTSALAIHFDDYPDFRGLRAPDGEHLEAQDAERFSHGFGRVLGQAVGSRESR